MFIVGHLLFPWVCVYVVGITISDRLVAMRFGCLLSGERVKGEKTPTDFNRQQEKKAAMCFETGPGGSTGAPRRHLITNGVTSGLFPFG